jgi:hypothetical protein
MIQSLDFRLAGFGAVHEPEASLQHKIGVRSGAMMAPNLIRDPLAHKVAPTEEKPKSGLPSPVYQ